MQRCTPLMLISCLVAILGASCSSREDKTRAECVGNMEAVWAAAFIYRVEHGTNAEFVFTPPVLAGYCKGPLWRCPLGTNDYPPFTYASGPRCPNAPTSHVGAASLENGGLLK